MDVQIWWCLRFDVETNKIASMNNVLSTVVRVFDVYCIVAVTKVFLLFLHYPSDLALRLPRCSCYNRDLKCSCIWVSHDDHVMVGRKKDNIQDSCETPKMVRHDWLNRSIQNFLAGAILT